MALNLVLDAGGTRLKWAWCRGTHCLAFGGAPWPNAMAALAAEKGAMESQYGPLRRAARLARPWPPAAAVLPEAALAAALGAAIHVAEVLDRLPFAVDYATGTPGTDRMAAAMACHQQDPTANWVILDAGTCITIDLLCAGQWRGGAILPGLQLQSEAMAQAGLPVLQRGTEGEWHCDLTATGALGTTTMAALEAGIPRAVHIAVTGTVEDLRKLTPDVNIMLTGGDAFHFDGLGGWRTFADPNLVLIGAALLLNDSPE